MSAFGKRPAVDRANDSSADYKHAHRVNPSHIQFFFAAADRIAGSPNATHCAISARRERKFLKTGLAELVADLAHPNWNMPTSCSNLDGGPLPRVN